MRIKRIALVIVLAVLGLALLGRGWVRPEFALTAISGSAIPDALTAEMANLRYGSQKPRDLTWRVNAERVGYRLIACTFTIIGEHSKYETLYRIWRYDGIPSHAGLETVIGPADSRFDIQVATDLAAKKLIAYGTALDPRAALIRADATTGLSFFTQPVDGFWAIEAELTDLSLKWASFSALTADGQALYTISADRCQAVPH